ncbi:nitrile hydratase subunit beta [Streptomyces sp. SHP 1-2]|nr:nitrile hydratase subunit beta [Streptomyces sp. SHP 1-2]
MHDEVRALVPGEAGRHDRSLPDLERCAAPWESSMQATCESLSMRGSLDNLERRKAEDALGESVYADYPVHARSALTVAHTLIERGVLKPQQITERMRQVRVRLEEV